MKEIEASMGFESAHLKGNSLRIQMENVEQTLTYSIAKELVAQKLIKFDTKMSGNTMVITAKVKAQE